MNGEKKPKVKLMALWAMKGGRGYTGRLGDARVVAWINDRKQNERSPDLTVYLEEGEPYQKKGEAPKSRPAPSESSDPDDRLPEDDRPF